MDESDRKMKQILNDIPDMLLDGNYTPNLKQFSLCIIFPSLTYIHN